jgi:hypothetical protein
MTQNVWSVSEDPSMFERSHNPNNMAIQVTLSDGTDYFLTINQLFREEQES